jgi:hypothetical protein
MPRLTRAGRESIHERRHLRPEVDGPEPPDAEKSVTRQVEHATEQAVQVAMEAARKTLTGSSARRAAIDRELRTLAGRVGRLTEAVAAGTGATAPLLEKLAAEEARRGALVREHAALDASARTIDLTSEKILRAIRQRANDIRDALLTHREEAAEVLRAFVSRID